MVKLKAFCQIRRSPGLVVLKRLGLSQEAVQAATKRALEGKAEILSQVLPTSRELIFIGGTTCDRGIRHLREPVSCRSTTRAGIGAEC
ncbi:hypothetical protein CO652_04660 [Rhizobium sp. H4]|nr:hypothetical protein CO652_04660 [Rhizobium sp. H4]